MTLNGLQHHTSDDFRQRVLDVSSGAAMPPDCIDHGDHRINSDLVGDLLKKPLRPAAVLVPVFDREGEARVLLTQRTAKLRAHSGQIAFPGGAIDPGDRTAERAALREAEEEIGLDPAFVEPLARLPDYLTTSGFRITPVLARVHAGFALSVNPHEVRATFDVPLSFLMNPDNHRRESGLFQGKERHYFSIPYGPWFIWGVTAGILRVLYERYYA